MEYEKPVQATSFSTKLSNGGLMAPAKAHPYDGVFVNGRSGKLRSSGAVVDGSDYAKIFRAGSTACTIPVLDIPELFDQGTATSGGGRSSRPVDYSKIFGGLGDSTDFAVPFEELLPPKKPNISNGASTRTPAETRTRSHGRSRQLSFSEEKLEPSWRPPEQPLAGVEEFNVKAEQHTVHGYTRLAGEAVPSQVTGVGGKAERSGFDDARVGDSAGELPRIPKLSRRAVSGPRPRVDVSDASQRYVKSWRRSSRSGSMSNDTFDAFENGVDVHSSGIPSPSSTTSKARNYAGASRTNMPEHERSNCSPSFSDEEVDANSVAAASAAAVRKAIEEAQAKIKLAKELMERKKEGRVNFAKMNSGNGFKTDKKVARTAEMLNSSREKEDQAIDGKEQTPTCIARMSNHRQRIASQVSPDFRDKKEFSTAQASRGLHEKESSLCLLDQTAEAYGNERASIRGSQSDIAVNHDSVGTEVTEEDTEQGKITREIEIVPGIFQWKFDANSFKSAQELEHEEEHDLEVGNVHDLGEADQAPNLANEHEPEEQQLERKLEEFEVVEGNDVLESQGDNRDMPEMGEAISGVETIDHETEGCSQNLEDTGIVEVVGRKGNKMRLHRTNSLDGKSRDLESTECQENSEGSSGPGADEYRENNGSWEQDNEMKYVEICEENVIELRSNDLHGKEESNRGEVEDGVRDHDKDTVAMDELILDMDYPMDIRENQLEVSSEADRMHAPTCLSTGDKGDMEVPQQASIDEDIKHVDSDTIYNQDDIENFRETEEGGWYEETLEDVSVTAERMEFPADANGTEESDKEQEGREDAHSTVEDGFDAVPHAQDLTNLEHTMQGSETLVTTNNTESAAETDILSQQNDIEDHLGGLLDVHDQEIHVEEVVCDSDEDAHSTVEDGFDAVPHAQDFTNLEHTMQGSETLVTTNNTESAAETDILSQQNDIEDHLGGLLDVHDQEIHVEEVVCDSDESNGDIDEYEVRCNEEEDESDTISEKMRESQATCVFPERTVEQVEEPITGFDVEENIVTDEDEIASIHEEEGEMASMHGEEDNAFQSSYDERQMDNQMHVETSEQPSSSEGVVRMTEVKFQSSENKEESHHKAERKEVESQFEARIQNIRNLEKDELREKARQRIVVDRAIKEARERAFAEARERAERAAADKAAAEAQQRETAAASKKPEKASSEANGTADKAAKNAKLKAERAAVERATNEARERALEKALAEKAAASARNQAAKTATEKFSSVSRDDVAKARNDRSYGHQQNGYVTSSSSRQPSSSHHAAEKSGVPNNVNESGYWSKATLERHQRTAERAAKALAEKNMRDLLAQREQAERHRLAETLDADVKRWLSGKERNLRALLSTLQYILGSDSGWQPIPLTDLVSTAAVKKAYRKATLVVHPDKLQQRGASIQQKYTCEKVFDLLQEAWNKFSAEER